VAQHQAVLRVDYTDIAMLAVKTRDKQYVLINQNGARVAEGLGSASLGHPAEAVAWLRRWPGALQ
jgi:2-keto-4-pentenoate hydratase